MDYWVLFIHEETRKFKMVFFILAAISLGAPEDGSVLAGLEGAVNGGVNLRVEIFWICRIKRPG